MIERPGISTIQAAARSTRTPVIVHFAISLVRRVPKKFAARFWSMPNPILSTGFNA